MGVSLHIPSYTSRMMEDRFTHHVRTFIIICFILGNMTLEIMASEINRVVYQTFLLSEGETVQCYGQCDRDLKGGLRQKFKLTRCEGRKIRFSCKPGYRIKIHVATLGKLSPDLDICNYKGSLECAENISSKVQRTCNSGYRCAIDVTNDELRYKCGKVKNLALDVKYLCQVIPTTTFVSGTFPTSRSPYTTPKTTTKITKLRSSSTKVVKSMSNPTVNYKTTTTAETTPISTLLSMTSPHSTQTYDNHTVTMLKDTDMFLTLIAYSAISDSEFIKIHKGPLALVLLLSMFLGVVLCLCIFLDYCRRTKIRRDRDLKETKSEIPELQPVECNERIELINSKMAERTRNDSSPNQKFIIYANNSNNNTNNNNNNNNKNNNNNNNNTTNSEGEDADVYANMSVTTPFINRNPEHDLFLPNHINPDEETSLSSASLPPSQNDFLVETTLALSHDLLTPTVGCKSDKNHTPCLIVTSATSTGSSNNTLMSQRKTNQRNSVIGEIKEIYFEERPLDDNLASSLYEYTDVGQYHASDDYSSSPMPNSMAYHRTDNYVVPPCVQLAPTNKRPINKDEILQEDTFIRNVDSKRMRKCNPKDKPGLHKCRSLDEPKKKTYFANNGNQYLVRNPRRGRIHVMQSCDESVPQRSCNQKAIYSDNEASRRRRRCEMEYKRSCSCHEQGLSLNDLYCTKCGKSEESHLNGCSSLTSNCQSSHDEAYGDHHGPLLSISDERIKNEEYCIEESGYQSHDTGTDSLCSSTFSTDQEDSRMFLPSSVNNAIQNGCRSKTCHDCCQASKHVQKLIIVRDQYKSKVPRRCRREDYTKDDVHLHDNHTSVDVHSYDSSMDDASSRDSVQLVRRMRKQKTDDCDLTGLDGHTNCNCIYGVIPSEN